jgi:hypothetical protein
VKLKNEVEGGGRREEEEEEGGGKGGGGRRVGRQIGNILGGANRHFLRLPVYVILVVKVGKYDGERERQRETEEKREGERGGRRQ